MENPFRIGEQVTGEYFTDRADEVKRILAALRQPTRLLVFGARRMGKSSAIRVATEQALREGVLVVRADLSTASGAVDVANRLLTSLSMQRPRGWLASFAASLAPAVSLEFDGVTGMPRVVFSADRRRGSATEQRASLESVIDRLGKDAGEGERVAVVLDEFQAIRRFGGEEAEWHLRDLIQRHGELSFVCAGSEVSLIREMLESERAFFRTFELLHMGPVPADHLARWIDERLETAGLPGPGVGSSIIELAGPRTQDILQVARHVYARGSARGGLEDTDVTEAMEDVVREEDPVIRATWLDLTAQQQNVLRAVAAEAEHLFSEATRRRFGLPTSSSVAAAVDAVEKRGILHREGTEIRFDSPFTRLWVVWEALGDVPGLGG